MDYSDSSDCMKALKLVTDTTATNPDTSTDGDGNAIASAKYNYEFLARLGESNNDLVAISGTISSTKGLPDITGSSTTFTSDFSVGDVIAFQSAGVNRFMGIVMHIESNTALTLDRGVPHDYSGVSAHKQGFKIDHLRDSILGKVKRASNVYTYEPFTNKLKIEKPGEIADNTVNAAISAENSIGAVQIAFNSIQGLQIVADSIDESLIEGNTITAASIAAGTITSAEMAANSITSALIAANAVNVSEIKSDSITNAAIQANAIGSVEILANAIGTTQIAVNSVNGTIVAQDAVDTTQLKAGAVSGIVIAGNGIFGSSLQSSSITAAKIASDEIIERHIVDGNISTNKIAANAVTAAIVAANAIESNQLKANSVTAAAVLAGTITNTQIAGNTINSAVIQAGAVDTNQIAGSAITNAKVAANAVETAQIKSGEVVNASMAANAITNAKISSTDSMTLTVDGGTAGGWALTSSTFSAGSPTVQANNFTDQGIQLNSAGSIHAKQFHIDSSGNAKFKGTLEGNDVTVNGTLTLPSAGGSTSVSFFANDQQTRFITSVGSGAGFYQGFIKLTGGTSHVKTMGFFFIESSASSGTSSSFDIDLRSGSSFNDTKLPLASSSSTVRNHAIYPSPEAVPTTNNDTGSVHDRDYGLRPDHFDPLAGEGGGVDSQNRLYSGHQSANMPFMFTYTGTDDVNLFMRAQGDSGTDTCTVEARFIKFGVS